MEIYEGLGGGKNGKGSLSIAKLKKILKDFHISIDLQSIIDPMVSENKLDYEQFKEIFMMPEMA